MTKFVMTLVAALLAGATVASAAEDPTPEEITEYAFNYMRQESFREQNFSDREIANQLASSIYWLEKVQLLCPSYYYVNADRVRYMYLLRQGTWSMMFGPGKTSTSILVKNNARRNEEFNNASKKAWCEDVKAFGIKTFGWAPLFEADQQPTAPVDAPPSQSPQPAQPSRPAPPPWPSQSMWPAQVR